MSEVPLNLIPRQSAGIGGFSFLRTPRQFPLNHQLSPLRFDLRDGVVILGSWADFEVRGLGMRAREMN